MDLGPSTRVKTLVEKVKSFIAEELEPVYPEIVSEHGKAGAWQHTDRELQIFNSLKVKAKEKDLWNFFLPNSTLGAGLTNVDFAHLAEPMGWNPMAPQCFNCAAPDTGNKETRSAISEIKVAVPSMALKVIDRAIQIHGGSGLSPGRDVGRHKNPASGRGVSGLSMGTFSRSFS